MEIRRATEADVSEIAQIWHLGWHQGHAGIVAVELVKLRIPAEFVTRTAAHLGLTHVAVLEDEIAGFFMIKENELYQFYVAPHLKGSGIASKLMAHAEAALAGREAHLACSVGNERAAAFYRKCGWAHVRTGPYEVETSAGLQVVQEWRFEKKL